MLNRYLVIRSQTEHGLFASFKLGNSNKDRHAHAIQVMHIYNFITYITYIINFQKIEQV